MRKTNIFMTGATGAMGSRVLAELENEEELYDITILSLDDPHDKKILSPYKNRSNIKIYYGNLENYMDVFACVRNADIILHIAAFVSPFADSNPQKAMDINFGSTKNIVDAVIEHKREEVVKMVYIGSVAELGDRTPPIHWGRVGDPVKPSIYDYYALSKVRAERYVIESEIKNWVCLRQTGMMGPLMVQIRDPILFHNGIDNVFEYVSDRDSGRLLKNLCDMERKNTLPENFWNHIYNIGGGEKCRISGFEFYKRIFAIIGIKNTNLVLNPHLFATRNFHGQYYLDSDRLEEILHFRSDTIDYLFECFEKSMKPYLPFTRKISSSKIGEKALAFFVRIYLRILASKKRGTLFINKTIRSEKTSIFWGTRKAYENIPDKFSDFKVNQHLDNVITIDHGFDEKKNPIELNLNDIKRAARFRGGECLSSEMKTGDWTGKLSFCCAFGHTFMASPRLVLEGGHWCPICQDNGWNYAERAKKDSFFAQVWDPINKDSDVKIYKNVLKNIRKSRRNFS